jgi:hypothetical protein
MSIFFVQFLLIILTTKRNLATTYITVLSMQKVRKIWSNFLFISSETLRTFAEILNRKSAILSEILKSETFENFFSVKTFQSVLLFNRESFAVFNGAIKQ